LALSRPLPVSAARSPSERSAAAPGAIVLRQKCSRAQVEARFINMPPCLIGMEACVGKHHLKSQASSAWPRRSADAGEIRSHVKQRTEERLPRCGGDRRGGATSHHEVRCHQERRSAGFASAAPRARAVGWSGDEGSEHNALQTEAGYIDARPRIRQIDETLLQRTAGPYIRSKTRIPLRQPNDSFPGCENAAALALGKLSVNC
jgi:hypothetical protein